MGQYTSNWNVRVYIQPQSKLFTQTYVDTSNRSVSMTAVKVEILTIEQVT